MKIDNHVDLYSQNTMRLHCVADVVYYPESNNDLLELVRKHNNNCLYLAAGSNVILPKHLSYPVVSLMSLNEKLEMLEDGRVYVGCSIRVQKLIRFLQNHSLGGIEYLFSVPASVGGLIYMNGGRGKKFNVSISDYLDKVEYLDLDDMLIKEYIKRESDFSYRTSPFQSLNVIILSAIFKFKRQDYNYSESLIKDRLNYSKVHLSPDKPSCGSVFRKGNKFIFRALMGMRSGGAMYSKRTPNWISNMGDATYEDICKLIKRGKTLHKLFFIPCDTEVRIIKE